MQAGIGLLTEDRKRLGLLLELSIRENASLAHLDEISRFWVVDKRASAASSTSTSAACTLRAGSWEQPVSSLSGGNQQKVLLARWLATNAKVLMFDEPTKGVDVGAKSEIYNVIGDLAAEGLGVIVVSSYLPEVLGLADRVLVMREGTVAGELPAAGATEEDVLRLASTARLSEERTEMTTQHGQRPPAPLPRTHHRSARGAHPHLRRRLRPRRRRPDRPARSCSAR